MKRKVFRLTWDQQRRAWRLLKDSGLVIFSYPQQGETKKVFVRKCAQFIRKEQPSQLIIHNKNGQIAEERTYGSDPKRHKG